MEDSCARARDPDTVLGIVDHLRRRSATADSSSGEFAPFKSATGRTRCGELSVHLLDLRGLLVETAVSCATVACSIA